MMIKVIENKISKKELADIAQNQFGSLVKAVIDVKKGIMAVGGELHSDEEALLLEQGSLQEDLWGINLYPGKSGTEWMEFHSMINLRPTQGNSSLGIDDAFLRDKIRSLVEKLAE